MNKYLDCEKYKVDTYESDGGKKSITIVGYCYHNERGYQHVYCSGCYLDIDDVRKNGRDAVDDALMACKQYQYDMDEKEVGDYYDGIPELAMTDVTEETPCGWYIDPTFKQ